MNSPNLAQQIILHYAAAIVLIAVVMLDLVPDTGISLLLAFAAWCAFCMAGHLSLCYDERNYGRQRRSVIFDLRNLGNKPRQGSE